MLILGISGSLRRGSHNARLLRAAARKLPPWARLCVWDELAAIPPFNEDHEDRRPDPAVRRRADLARLQQRAQVLGGQAGLDRGGAAGRLRRGERAHGMTSVLQSPAVPRDIWYLGTLLHLRARGADTSGAYSLVEEHLPRGFAPPRHTHTREDEAFVVLDGELTFWLGEERFTAVGGQSAFLPRGVEHTFRVDSVAAHVLNILSPAGFEQFFVDLGEPARTDELPPAPAGPPDVARMAALLAGYGVQLNGPPPPLED